MGILTIEKYPDMFLLITNPTLLTATLSRPCQCLATMGLGKLLFIVQPFQVVCDMLAFSQCTFLKSEQTSILHVFSMHSASHRAVC